MPTTPKLEILRCLAAKTESTPGTDVAVTGSDATFVVFDPKLTPNDPISERPNQAGGGLLASTPNANTARLTFSVEITGNGTTGLPAWSTFLQGCGYTFSSQTGTYSGTANATTLTMAMYEDGKKRVLYGARGNVKFTKTNDSPGRADFEFIGKYKEAADTSILSPTLPTVIAPITNTVTYTSGTVTYTPTISQISVDQGNSLQMREDAGGVSTGGFYAAAIVNWKPQVTLDPEVEATSTRDWNTLRANSTAESLSIVLGSVANNTITITGSAAQTIKIERGARNGLLVENITQQLNGAAPTQVIFS